MHRLLSISFLFRLTALLTFSALELAAGELEDLQTELQKLKEENSQLKQRLESQSESIKTLMQRLETLEKKPPSAAVEKDEEPAMDMGKTADAFKIPTLNLRWFGDVDFRAGGKVRSGNNQPNTFSLGQLGLMANSQLSKNVSVMSEIVFQYKENEEASTTIERLQLQYHASDLVNLRLGRTHTPFGYWNETFHHGTWFQTTSLRPEILRFHDDGSVLPIHSVGVEMYGYRPFSLLDVHYNLGVANGRGARYTDTVNIQDRNDHKAVYGVLSLAPVAVPGLRFGINGYGDVIPPDPATVARNGNINELITGAHAVYLRDKVELLSEAMRIEHDDKVTSRKFTTWGLYAQAAYQLGAFKPYFRFDLLDAAEGDPFYGPSVVDLKRYTVGLRWDIISWAALKLEYHYIDRDNLNNPNAFYAQTTFTF